MLVVLAEVDCLDYLQNLGVYPDAFYTDFKAFKSDTVMFDEVDVLIIFVGACQFNRQAVLSFSTSLRHRVEDELADSIRSVEVLTDLTLPKEIEYPYYRFENRLDQLKKVQGNKVGPYVVDFWNAYKGEEKESRIYLSAFDLGVETESTLAERMGALELKELERKKKIKEMIKVPNFDI